MQTTLVRAVERLPALRPGETGSFLAYMRQVLLNAVRDEIRRHHRRPSLQSLSRHRPEGDDIELVAPASDPTITAAYERGLGELSAAQREAVVLRVEFGLTFPEIALELGLASADAARMRVSRALADLADRMPR